VRLRPLVVASRGELEEELRRVEVDETSIGIFLDKRDCFLVKISDLSTPAANILKQTALSFGADVAVHREVITGRVERSDAIYMGTRRQLKRTALALSGQPFGLAALERKTAELLKRLETPPAGMKLVRGELRFDRPLVMGVLNVTPDSFSDGGRFLDRDAAKRRIDEMLEEGADVVDVGAESTRPGSEPVPASRQLERLEPVFEHLEHKGCIWSLDTTNPEVARAGLKAGASILNDTSGGADAALVALARDHGAAYVLMHIQGTPKTMQESPHYDDFNAELYDFFARKLTQMAQTGFPLERVIIDPGIGFGKRVADNTAAIRRLGELRAFGVPVLVGASRKSFLGKLLGLEVHERLEASIAVAVLAWRCGAHLLRVHDVKETRRALDAAAACFGAEERTW